jgi:hypothetical protein
VSAAKRRWFRVVVDDKGKAVDCRPVGDEGTASLGVFYILAADASEAARKAGNEHARVRLAARRARYVAEGLCKCGRTRDRENPTGGFWKDCSSCAASMKRHDERAAARKRGEDVPKPDRRAVLLERKEQDAGAIRCSTLIEVQNMHAKLGLVPFKRWLAGQIDALAGRKAG